VRKKSCIFFMQLDVFNPIKKLFIHQAHDIIQNNIVFLVAFYIDLK